MLGIDFGQKSRKNCFGSGPRKSNHPDSKNQMMRLWDDGIFEKAGLFRHIPGLHNTFWHIHCTYVHTMYTVYPGLYPMYPL